MKTNALSRTTLYTSAALMLAAFGVFAFYLHEQNFFAEPSMALDSSAMSSAESMNATGANRNALNQIALVRPLDAKSDIREDTLPEDITPKDIGTNTNAQKSEPLTLWQMDSSPKQLEGGVAGFQVLSEIDALEQLNVNEQVSISLPEFDAPLKATINQTYNELGGVEMYQGDINYSDAVSFEDSVYHGHEDDNIVIAKGQIKTHITIATRKATYSLIIDNASGKGTLINEAEYIAQQSEDFNDAIRVTNLDDSAPAL